MYGIPRLPNKLFLVRVPIIATYSPEELDILGLPVTYNFFGNYDDQAYRNLTTCMLPLDRLIDIYTSNFPIYIVNHGDIQVIHDILVKYIEDAYDGPADPNIRYEEDERIEDIERFAMEMFDINLAHVRHKKEQQVTFGDTQIAMLPRLPVDQIVSNPVVDSIAASAKAVDLHKPNNRQLDNDTSRQVFTLVQPTNVGPVCTQNTYFAPTQPDLPVVDISSAFNGLPTIDPTKKY